MVDLRIGSNAGYLFYPPAFATPVLIQIVTFESGKIIPIGAFSASWISVRVLAWIASFQMAAPFPLRLYIGSICS